MGRGCGFLLLVAFLEALDIPIELFPQGRRVTNGPSVYSEA